MKLTCLSKGDGFRCPPCHMLNLCGFRILIDCPLDLSAITIFSPVPHDICSREDSECPSDLLSEGENSAQKRQRVVDKQLSRGDLVCAEPWYKTVNTLHLWDVSFIDVVLISSPMGLLGLPFLTQNPGFSAKIYVTEATAKIGQLMMEDLVSMHVEFRQFYGPEDSSFPWWIKQVEHEEAPSSLKKIVFGEDGGDLGCWVPLYGFDDIKDCVKKIQAVKFAEEVCYNGTLIIKALSSGLDIGTSNWLIDGPKGSISYVSGSIFASEHTMHCDYHGLKGSDVILYSDFSCLDSADGAENCGSVNPTSNGTSALRNVKTEEDLAASLLSNEENLEEMEKLAFICSCAVDSAGAGGSTLIAISRVGIVLQLLELIATSLESSSLKTPIYVISSVAEELLAYMNTVPEWLCQQRQDKFISGEPLFGHVKFIKDRKILLFPAIYSPDLIISWQEPCIIFAPHWSLRLGPAVQILRRWSGDPKALLVLEDGIAASLALLPFRPIAMKVLQCSFLSGIKLQKLPTLLTILQPKIVLLLDIISQRISFPEVKPYSVLNYSENKTLRVPKTTDGAEVEIAMDLHLKLKRRTLKHENFTVARLRGEVLMDHGKHRLLAGLEHEPSTQARPLRHWGSFAPETLLDALKKMDVDGSIECKMGDNESEEIGGVILITSPKEAMVEIAETGTVVTTEDEDLASEILQTIDGVLDGI